MRYARGTMTRNTLRTSFLIRFWHQRAGSTQEESSWRAQITHVQSGEYGYVDDLSSLIAFMERWTGTLANGQSSAPFPSSVPKVEDADER